jgi:hypothetical protein
MNRRWIIRSISIGLLLLCVTGWGCSFLCWAGIQNRQDATTYEMTVSQGTGQLDLRWGYETSTPEGWSLDIGKIGDGFPTPAGSRALGFHIAYENSPTDIGDFEVDVPLWFPTGVSVILVWLAWRKTRPVGHAFPVEA